MRYSSIAVVALAFGAWFVPLLAAEKSIDELIRQLNGDTFAERELAAKELVALGPKALEPLRKGLLNSDKEIARRAKECVAQIERNEQIAGFLAQIDDADPKRRSAAIGGLQTLQYDPEKLAAILIKALDDPDAVIRRAALNSLAGLGLPGRKGIPRMLEILKDDKEPVPIRYWVLRSLGRIGNCEEQAAPILLPLLESKDTGLRLQAAVTLGKVSVKDGPAITVLVNAMNDADTNEQTFAIECLGELVKKPDVCVPALIDRLRTLMAKRPHKEQWQKQQFTVVMSSLGAFGSEAAKAAPMIGEIAKETEPAEGEQPIEFIYRRSVAYSALENIGTPAVPVLTGLYKSTDLSVRSSAAIALTRITGNKYDP